MSSQIPSTSNVGHHARIVREMATLRGLTVVGEGIQRLGCGDHHAHRGGRRGCFRLRVR
jgi:replicative DNA helicase